MPLINYSLTYVNSKATKVYMKIQSYYTTGLRYFMISFQEPN